MSNKVPQRSCNNPNLAWLAVGIGIGTAIGVATKNIGLGIGLGVATGLCLTVIGRKVSKPNESDSKKDKAGT